MDKKKLKIAGLALGFSMAVAGLGTALVASQGYAPIEANAADAQFARYTGALTEGDYLIVYDGGAMNTTVSSDRLQYGAVSPNSNDKITINDASQAALIWHIAASGDYWTIYSSAASKYAAGTGAKNKAQLLASGTDNKSLWTVSVGTNTYDFVNKANTAASVNATLRRNGTYGFACYATSTGGALSLYKKVEASGPTKPLTAINDLALDADTIYAGKNTELSFEYTPTDTDEEIVVSSSNKNVATVSGTYEDGIGIYTITGVAEGSATLTVAGALGTVSDSVTITVLANPVIVTLSGALTKLSYQTTDAWDSTGLTASGVFASSDAYTGTFAFTFDPATPAAMGAGENQELTITATATTGDFATIKQIVNVTTPFTGNVFDTLTQSDTKNTGTTYSAFTSFTKEASGATYSGACAGDKSSIQLRSKNSDSGVFVSSAGKVAVSVSIVWHSDTANGRTLNVYGKNTPYSAPGDLYNSTKQGTLLGTIVKGTSTELLIPAYATKNCHYLGFCSNDGAMYITSITIGWAHETAASFAAFVNAFQSKPGADCTSIYDEMVKIWNNVTDKANFTEENFKDAYDRIEAYAAANGKKFDNSKGFYTAFSVTSIGESKGNTIVLVSSLLAVSGAAAFGMAWIVRKRKKA